jgi:hypothetical protein
MGHLRLALNDLEDGLATQQGDQAAARVKGLVQELTKAKSLLQTEL